MKLRPCVLGFGLVLLAARTLAVPALIVSDGATSVTVAGANGIATYATGTFDAYWGMVAVTAETMPAVGSAANPYCDVTVNATSNGSGGPPLTLTFSEGGYTPSPPPCTMVSCGLSGHTYFGTGQNVSYNTYYDPGNVVGATNTPLTATGLLGGPSYTSTTTNTICNPGPLSITQVLVVDPAAAGGAGYTLDASLYGANLYPITLTNATRLADGSFQFGFTNTPGMVSFFQVLMSTNPAAALSNWTALSGLVETSPGYFQFTDSQVAAARHRFYRVRSQ